MYLYLLTAPILAFPICLAFSSAPVSADDIARSWFAGLGGGALLVAVEMVLRSAIEIVYSPAALIWRLALVEASAPIVISVGLFYAFAKRYRDAPDAERELATAAFLSGCFTVRSVYHALAVAEGGNAYWIFLSPTIVVSAIFVVPSALRAAGVSRGWIRVLSIAGAVVLVLGYTMIPFLWALRYDVMSIVTAVLFGIAGVLAWTLRPVVVGVRTSP